ncbi:MAG: hypothetical protein GYB68_14870 [Chloroflexi bacterium]|nr:hypothetical protein [Chloroflexota bacterium]
MSQVSAQRRRKGSRYNLLGMLGALGLAFACLLIFLPAAYSSNPLFFIDTFVSSRPALVTVYYEGWQASFDSSDPEFDLLVDGAYESIASQNGFISMGWSERRFNQARTEGIALEMFYDEPVVLPGNRVDIGDVRRLFIPLDVFGSGNPWVVFRGGDDLYWGDPIRLSNMEPVRQAVEQVAQDR